MAKMGEAAAQAEWRLIGVYKSNELHPQIDSGSWGLFVTMLQITMIWNRGPGNVEHALNSAGTVKQFCSRHYLV